MSKINMIKHLQFYKRIYVNQKVLLDIMLMNLHIILFLNIISVRTPLYDTYQISITFMYLF